MKLKEVGFAEYLRFYLQQLGKNLLSLIEKKMQKIKKGG
jgi:hypothetical protein